MWNRILGVTFASAIGFVGASESAFADLIGRYECNVVGVQAPEPVGDRTGHNLVSTQFSCFGVDGLLKNAVYSATNVTEWDGPKATQLQAGGTHRTAGGLAVTQILEGTASTILKDGKPVGGEGSGTAAVKFASGTLAAMTGKTVKFTTKSTGAGRFILEFTD
jgi:hypothetical protein